MNLRIAALVTVLLAASVPVSSQTPTDSIAIERSVFVVLDDFIAAFSRGDAKAEEATYHFPHYRLANESCLCGTVQARKLRPG